MHAIPGRSSTTDVVEIDDHNDTIYDAVVIGAGIAGLTAALELRRTGHRLLVLEASDRVGGAIRTLREDGYIVECGPNTVLDTHQEVSRLIEDAGIRGRRTYASDSATKRYVVRDGEVLPLPTSPGSFLKTPLFSTRAKLRLGAEPFIGRSNGKSDESVASFTTRRLGHEFLDYAIDPFVSGVYAGNPERLSVHHAFPRLGEVERQYGSLIVGQVRGARARKRRGDTPKAAAKMFSFQDGLDELPRSIAEKLGHVVHTGCRATSLVFSDPVWLVQYEDARGGRRVVSAKSVLYASGLQNAGLLRSLAGEFDALGAVEYPPLSVVALGFRSEDVRHPLDGFGLLVPSQERRFILGALFSSSLFSRRAPRDHVLITAFVGGARSPENAGLSDQRLLAATVRDLKDLLGVVGSPMWYDITRWEKAIPQYNLGYGVVKDALKSIRAKYPGLFFAGNYLSGISVADAIKSGYGAADEINVHFSQPATVLP